MKSKMMENDLCQREEKIILGRRIDWSRKSYSNDFLYKRFLIGVTYKSQVRFDNNNIRN